MMLTTVVNRLISRKQKNTIKRKYSKFKKQIVDTLYGYDRIKLKSAFTKLGVEERDTVFLHSSYNIYNGFNGSAQDIIECLIEMLGIEGNLLMPSMPYTCSSYEYLKKNPLFNVSKTPSKMGLISEIFRRKKGVVRSLHATHPILAYGKDAAWLIEKHEKCVFPFGENTPFDKMRTKNSKILFFDVPFNTFTFFHYIEELIKDKLPFPLYDKQLFKARMINYNEEIVEMKTYVIGSTAREKRNPFILEQYLCKSNMLNKVKVGNTKLMLVKAEDAILCALDMMKNNIYFYNDYPY